MAVKAYYPIPGGTGLDARNREAIRQAIDSIVTTPIVAGAVAFPLRTVGNGDQLAASDAVAMYAGPASASVVLPSASAAGKAISLTVTIVNASGSSVSVKAPGTDTAVGGPFSVAANKHARFISDGNSRWFAE